MTRRFRACVALGAFASACACAPHAPRLAHPYSVRSFCGTREARLTGVDSVMTSTNDTLLDARPDDAEVLRAVEAGDGLIAYWHEQPLALPRVAKELGETDGYVRVDAAGVPPVEDLATTRPLYLKVRDGSTTRWIVLTAFDAQDVCVEGHRDV